MQGFQPPRVARLVDSSVLQCHEAARLIMMETMLCYAHCSFLMSCAMHSRGRQRASAGFGIKYH